MNTAPLEECEYEVILAALAGDCYELELLRKQLDSVRYESPYYRPQFLLGLGYRPSRIRRRRSLLQFRIPFGSGTEDWFTANRSEIHFDDVVLEEEREGLLATELIISEGLLREFKVLGRIEANGRQKNVSVSTKSLRPRRILYAAKDTGLELRVPSVLTDVRSPSAYSALLPPVIDAPLDSFQSWLMSFEDRELPVPHRVLEEYGIRLSLKFRRTARARPWEIEAFEARAGEGMPKELRSLWLFTNGGVFFGHRILSNQEAYVHRYRNAKFVTVLRNQFDDVKFITIRLGESSSCGEVTVCEFDSAAVEEVQTWPGLAECFEELASRGPWVSGGHHTICDLAG